MTESGVVVEYSPELKAMLAQDEGDIQHLISNTLDRLCIKTERLIKTPKQPWSSPIDTGRLRAGHTSNLLSPLEKYITNSVHYWKDIVYGHKTPIAIKKGRGWYSDKQRRWWYWYLNAKLGGKYELKTKDYYVEPNNYPHHALVQLRVSGELKKVLEQEFINHYTKRHRG